jgi:hypothetical protein
VQGDVTTITTTFEFDRASQTGFGPKTFGDGAVDNPEAVEQIADRVRDEILRHVDVADAIGGVGGVTP